MTSVPPLPSTLLLLLLPHHYNMRDYSSQIDDVPATTISAYNMTACCSVNKILPQCMPLCTHDMKLSDLENLYGTCQPQLGMCLSIASQHTFERRPLYSFVMTLGMCICVCVFLFVPRRICSTTRYITINLFSFASSAHTSWLGVSVLNMDWITPHCHCLVFRPLSPVCTHPHKCEHSDRSVLRRNGMNVIFKLNECICTIRPMCVGVWGMAMLRTENPRPLGKTQKRKNRHWRWEHIKLSHSERYIFA